MEKINTKATLPTDGGVYVITNTLNGMCYIGSTHNLKERFGVHNRRANQLYHNEALYKDIRKYGISNFTFKVLTIENDVYSRQQLENKYISEYATMGGIYNKCLKASLPHFMTDEERKRLSESHRHEKKYNPETMQFEQKEN